MATATRRDNISLSLLHHHTRAYCEETRELNCRLTILDEGKPLAALIPIEDLRLLERLIREEEDRIDIVAARAVIAEGGETIPWETVKAELGLPSVAEIDGETA